MSRRQPKQKPSPIMIPVSLYTTIRATAICQTLDSNPNNSMNEHSTPVQLKFGVGESNVTVICYSADLLKQWMRYLVTLSPFGGWRQALVQSKSRSGMVTYGSEKTERYNVLRLPELSELELYAAQTGTDKGTLTQCAYIVQKLIVNRDHLPTRLLLANDIVVGTLHKSTELATPGNLTRLGRLIQLGYQKISLSVEQTAQWENYHTVEHLRLGYLLNKAKGAKVSDKALKSLNDTDRESYNNQAVLNLMSMLPQGSLTEVTDMALIAPMGMLQINPAIVQAQRLNIEAKATKPKSENNNVKYSNMIKEYERMTRFKLDTKSEKSAKTLPRRQSELDWMYTVLKEFPLARFYYDQQTDRCGVIPMDPQLSRNTNYQQQYQPVTQQPSQQPQLPSQPGPSYANVSYSQGYNAQGYNAQPNQPKKYSPQPQYVQPYQPTANKAVTFSGMPNLSVSSVQTKQPYYPSAAASTQMNNQAPPQQQKTQYYPNQIAPQYQQNVTNLAPSPSAAPASQPLHVPAPPQYPPQSYDDSQVSQNNNLAGAPQSEQPQNGQPQNEEEEEIEDDYLGEIDEDEPAQQAE